MNYFQFGFSSSFRALIVDRDTLGARALIWMLAIAILLFTPMLVIGELDEGDYNGFIRPLTLAIPIGAFIFGIGMQIGCGCTSGTLNRVGQLQPLSFLTLFFMIIGGTFAAYTYNSWQWLPAVAPVAFQQQLGWPIGLLAQLAILLLLYKFLLRFEYKKHRYINPLTEKKWSFKFAHPFLKAGVLLAIFNALLFAFSGQPWSISFVFPLWGKELAQWVSLPVDFFFWDFIQQNRNSFEQGVLNSVSLTTFGVILGALVVTLLDKRKKVPFTALGAAMSIIGGLIMGFGAVMASGCNIGALFSGVASGSLHGWVWLVFALLGNILGVMIRARFMLLAKPVKA
ncbi:YeeE/YedE family protein [Thiomicrorhabdus sediminis]|uniref:YeeE/YedE family protein n=1 Tax=Thiomicrorhabdus sediminis TaxID=2580412 RepID=UPI001EE95A11|nr:YeeE/YedE family protein [Thiomicrorhabdus sediminis]